MGKQSLSVAVVGLAVVFLGVGCDFASSREAREVLETGREVRKIETEELAPRLAALDKLRAEQIFPREEQLESLHQQIREIHRTKIEPLHDQMRGMEPRGDPMMAVARDFESQMQSIMDQERAIELEFRALDSRFRDQQRQGQDSTMAAVRAKEDRMNDINFQLQRLHRDGRAQIDALYAEMRLLEGQLVGLAPDAADRSRLETRMGELRALAGQEEQQLQARARALEDEMNALSQELRQAHRGVDDQMRSAQLAFEAEMKALEEQRFALGDRRRELETSMRDRMTSYQTEMESKRLEIERRMQGFEAELEPLEAAADQIETELRTLRLQERALTQELRGIRDRVESMEGQLEDRLLDLLERAIDATPAPEGAGTTAASAAP
jgi:chromosome segregation ATPase